MFRANLLRISKLRSLKEEIHNSKPSSSTITLTTSEPSLKITDSKSSSKDLKASPSGTSPATSWSPQANSNGLATKSTTKQPNFERYSRDIEDMVKYFDLTCKAENLLSLGPSLELNLKDMANTEHTEATLLTLLFQYKELLKVIDRTSQK
jgi:hypothetical protein